MELQPRECPHCHRRVSLKICAEYFFYGTNHTVRCNHCNAKLSPAKPPVNTLTCTMIGFLCMALPAQYCLYVLHKGFLESISYGIILAVIAMVVILVLTLRRLFFKMHFE